MRASHRQGNGNTGAMAIGLDLDGTAELPDSFPHAPNTHTHQATRIEFKLFFRWYPYPIIGDFTMNKSILLSQANPCGGTSRVAVNIGKGFLHDAENGNLQILRQTIKSRWGQVQTNGNVTALGESVREPANGGLQANFVQQGRVQQMREGTNFR